MSSDERTLIFSLVFGFFLIFSSALWLKIKYGIPIRETFLTIWRECIVEGFKELRKNFIPVTKKVLGKIWEYIKENWGAIWGFIKEIYSGIVKFFYPDPEPVKHIFAPDLYFSLLAVASNYTHKFSSPVIRYFYSPIPSYIQVSLYYTKGAITDDIIAEIVWAMMGAFQDYMDTYFLNFQFQAFPYVERNRIVVRLYYFEFEAEYPAYQSKCDEIMQMRSTTRSLNEVDTYDRDF